MKYKYEVFTCNNGNPTAIITNCSSREKNGVFPKKYMMLCLKLTKLL